eukprot:TRINITY_DN5337_c0_g1_i1.p1 TRINITY_DN5337_c0_g1~~TRINITY_DN5337_c0_g1_i1.p1  ORF type:complete len:129 (-),score=16.97 TRINITY_DN5337_c0_g1_i1:33-419(-)
MDDNPGELRVYENTYITQPNPKQKFNAEVVRKVVEETVYTKLDRQKYNPSEATTIISDLCSTIQDQVKQFSFERYKIIVQVTLGEMKGEGCFISSRGLWDQQNDSYASYSFQNGSLFCVAMVFGCYTP